jgi:hypothetical protein
VISVLRLGGLRKINFCWEGSQREKIALDVETRSFSRAALTAAFATPLSN